MNTRLFFTHALAPLHAGTGQGVGVIDLPIAREKATGLPYLPGSSLKGTLRNACEDEKKRTAVFGPETKDGDLHAGAVHFSDQRLLLLPIRSLAGTFAWVTSPYVLRRFARELQDVNLNMPADLPPDPTTENQCVVADDCKLIVDDSAVYLEDLDLTAQREPSAKKWSEWIGQQLFADSEWQTFLTQRFCIVHDNVLTFLLTTATEITARIKLQEATKTVQQGGLWYEEALPTETILAGMLLAAPNGKTGYDTDQIFEIINECTGKPMQLGGKATVGRGLCRVILAKEGE
jgi:CRISPR-associated protein Cmr4